MKIKVNLNNEKYRYDVYQIYNLFFPLEEICFQVENADYEVKINNNNLEIVHSGKSKICNFQEQLNIKENIKKSIYLFLENETGNTFPWGTLIGIRPTKKAIEFINENKSLCDFQNYVKLHSLTRDDKAKLCYTIGKKEKDYINNNSKSVSIYIDMPFCPTRCLYCSFTSNPINKHKNNIVGNYILALQKEMYRIRDYVDEKSLMVQCVYFGGGTPTSISDEQFSEVIESIYKCFVQDRNTAEFTVECGRADSISVKKLMAMKKFGVSRISINPQTMNDETLKFIGRNHTVSDVNKVFLKAREMGFDNINMDIIIGLPGEGIEHIQKTCHDIAALKPDNITIHGLCIKRGSRFHEEIINKTRFAISNQETIDKMYKCTEMLADDLGMEPYYMYRQKNMVGNMENVGYCTKGKEGIYNIEMIEEKQTIIGIGADAVTKVIFLEENRIERFPNIKDVREYISRIDEKLQGKISLLNTLYKED